MKRMVKQVVFGFFLLCFLLFPAPLKSDDAARNNIRNFAVSRDDGWLYICYDWGLDMYSLVKQGGSFVLTATNKLYPGNVSGTDSVTADPSKYFYIISDKGTLSRWFYSSEDDMYYYEDLANELTDISCITTGDYHFLGTKSGKLYAYSFVVRYNEEKDNYFWDYVKIFEKQVHAKTVTSIIEYPFRRHFITAGGDGVIHMWKTPMNVSSFSSSAYVEAVPDEIFPVIDLETGKGAVSALALSADGDLLAAGGPGGDLQVWKIRPEQAADRLVFDNNFNTRGPWPEASERYSAQNGAYVMDGKNGMTFVTPGYTLGDGKIQVGIKRLNAKGGAAGVFFRCGSGSAYYILLFSANKYYLAKYVKRDWKPFINWTSHSAIKADAENVVTIEFRGAALSGSINNTPLFTVTDSEYDFGTFGFVTSGEIKVQYDNFKLWENNGYANFTLAYADREHQAAVSDVKITDTHIISVDGSGQLVARNKNSFKVEKRITVPGRALGRYKDYFVCTDGTVVVVYDVNTLAELFRRNIQ
jgi:WD40 repeat protein